MSQTPLQKAINEVYEEERNVRTLLEHAAEDMADAARLRVRMAQLKHIQNMLGCYIKENER